MIIKSRPEDRKNKENENCIFVKKSHLHIAVIIAYPL